MSTFLIFNRASIVSYDGCFVDTTNGAMNRRSGIFSVAEPGIYQLTFTAKYVSSNKGRFGAWSDIYVNHTVSQYLRPPSVLTWHSVRSWAFSDANNHLQTIMDHYVWFKKFVKTAEVAFLDYLRDEGWIFKECQMKSNDFLFKVIVDSQREYNGPDATRGGSGRGSQRNLSESSTHSVSVLYPLHRGDQVKVQFNKDGHSYIHSDNDHDVHFTGRRVAVLPSPPMDWWFNLTFQRKIQY